MFKRLVFVGLVLLGSVVCGAPAGEFPPEALDPLRSRAASGDQLAEARLQIYDKAVEGDSFFQFFLGNMFEMGDGVEQNMEYAAYWYRKAVDNGNRDAALPLGVMYVMGSGVENDFSEAHRLFLFAAEGGVAEAYTRLGLFSQYGTGGMKVDLEEAERWYILAIQNGVEVPEDALKDLAEAKRASFTESEAAFRDNLRKRAEDGDADAQLTLGMVYAAGDRVAKDEVEAVKWFRLAALQGNDIAQTKLAEAYQKGGGVERDPIAALAWHRLAAENESIGSMRALARVYRSGYPVGIDYDEALKWARMAAKYNLPEVENMLGSMMLLGQGDRADIEAAERHYRRAAELGYDAEYGLKRVEALKKMKDSPIFPLLLKAESNDVDVLFELAMRYSTGKGVAKDPAEAVKWFRKAANREHAEAQWHLGDAYNYSKVKGVEQDYVISHAWFMKAAENGHVPAMVKVANNYSRGLSNVQQNYEEARRWYARAMEAGSGEAASSLATMVRYGEGGPVDYEEAIRLYRRAIEMGEDAQSWLSRVEYLLEHKDDPVVQLVEKANYGDVEANYQLALRYANGDGVEADQAEAAKWYIYAAEKGNANAQVNIGYAYDMGTGVPVDKVAANFWYEMAAKQGNATATKNLGLTYLTGDGVEIDYAKALKWFEAGAELGDASSMYSLGTMAENGHGMKADVDKAKKWYRLAADNGHEEAAKRLKTLSAGKK